MVPVKTVLASRPGWKMTPGERTSWRDDDPLGAVDDEGALVRHHREVPHEDGLLLDLAGAGVHEPGPHEDRGGVGHVLFLALLHRELGRWAQVGIGRVELELEAQLTGEVLDGADVAEGLGQAPVEEPLERVPLDGDEVWQRQSLVDVGEGKTFRAVGPWRQRPTPPSCEANGAKTVTAVLRGLRLHALSSRRQGRQWAPAVGASSSPIKGRRLPPKRSNGGARARVNQPKTD